jgi:lipopolysaccharide/colanic/teichoic acid biosynthesis glycosyltransferase
VILLVGQRVLALVGLIVLGPLLLALAIAVRATSPGPALHRATRVRPGGTFTLYKLRSMRTDAGSGPAITAAGDARVTRLGRLLRRTKLDELPQLWNVVRGDMLFVGPRPEDPRYVDLDNPLHREVFGAIPGITGPAALAFRHEEAILAREALELARAAGRDAPTPDDVDRAYRERILPRKLEMDAEYFRTCTLRSDLRIIGRTLALALGRGGRAPD